MDNIETITLFVEDVDAARSFYQAVFDVSPVYADEVSWVCRIGSTMVNLLQESEAEELVEPSPVGARNAGPRWLLTVRVADVDNACVKLRNRNIELLNGPIDRPWGRRTAAFADPDGNVWEIAQEI